MKLINIKDNDSIAAVAQVPKSPEEEIKEFFEDEIQNPEE